MTLMPHKPPITCLNLHSLPTLPLDESPAKKAGKFTLPPPCEITPRPSHRTRAADDTSSLQSVTSSSFTHDTSMQAEQGGGGVTADEGAAEDDDEEEETQGGSKTIGRKSKVGRSKGTEGGQEDENDEDNREGEGGGLDRNGQLSSMNNVSLLVEGSFNGSIGDLSTIVSCASDAFTQYLYHILPFLLTLLTHISFIITHSRLYCFPHPAYSLYLIITHSRLYCIHTLHTVYTS